MWLCLINDWIMMYPRKSLWGRRGGTKHYRQQEITLTLDDCRPLSSSPPTQPTTLTASKPRRTKTESSETNCDTFSAPNRKTLSLLLTYTAGNSLPHLAHNTSSPLAPGQFNYGTDINPIWRTIFPRITQPAYNVIRRPSVWRWPSSPHTFLLLWMLLLLHR